MGFVGGAGASKAVKLALDKNPNLRKKAEKFAIMARLKAKKDNVMQYKTFKMIDESQRYGSKMKLIGKENLNADTLTYILSKNKRIAINKLDENTAKLLGFKYPSDIRRTIQPDEIVHTLNRHGEHSNLVKNSGQKAVTLNNIAKYQDYADNADMKGLNHDKQHNKVLVSFKRLDDEFYIIIEQIRKTQNELAYKDMYFGRGAFDENKLGEKIK